VSGRRQNVGKPTALEQPVFSGIIQRVISLRDLFATAECENRSGSNKWSAAHRPKRDGAQPPLCARGVAPTENILIKIDIDAQRQRAVGWSDWLDGLLTSTREAKASTRNYTAQMLRAPTHGCRSEAMLVNRQRKAQRRRNPLGATRARMEDATSRPLPSAERPYPTVER